MLPPTPTAYCNRLPRNVEWQNGGMAEWQNGGMAEWQNGGMAEWYFTTYLIYPAILMAHTDDTDDGFKSFRCTDYLVPATPTPPQPTAGRDHPPQVEKKRESIFGRSTTPLILSAAAGQIKGSRWHPQTAHHLTLCWVPPFAIRLCG